MPAPPLMFEEPMLRFRHAALFAAFCACLAARAALAAPAGFAFLEIPAGARAAALGGAFASVAQDVDAVFWNPAGLTGVKGVQISGTHAESFQKLRHDQFAVAGRWWGGGVAGSLRALYSDPIEERDDLGNLIGTFGGHDLEFALAYAHALVPGLALGGSAQVLRERIANAGATTYAFGAGGTWEPARLAGVRLAFSGHNLGPAAHYTDEGVSGQPVALPAAVQAGASYGFAASPGYGVRAALESRFTRGRGGIAMLGAELTTPVGAALRAGVRINDQVSNLSFGIGDQLPGLRVDYAFVPSRLGLEDTHRLSFSAQF